MARKPTYEELEQRVKELGREFLERKQAEKALRESEERYWEITSSIPGVVYQFLLKKDGSYSSPYISESASSILDISAKEAIANPYSLFDKIVKDDLDSVNQSIAESARTMEKWSQEFRIKTKTGEIRWMRATSIPHLLPNGEILWNGAILDISDRMQAQEALQRAHDELERRVEERAAELVGANKQLRAEIEERKQAEEALRASEAQKKAILDGSIDRIRLVDKDLRIIWANKTTLKKLNVAAEDLVGQPCYKVFHGRNSPCVECPAKKALETGQIEHAVLYRPKAQEVIKGETYVDSYGIPIKNESGDVVNIIQITRNITEHKLAEEELRASEAQKKAILDASVDRIRLADKDMRIIWANKTTVRELNMPPEDLEGEFCYKIFSDRDTQCPDCPSKKAFKSGNIEHAILYRPKLKDIEGETYWDAYAVPIKDESGDIVNMIEIARNITEAKRAEEALRESEEKYKTLTESSLTGIYIHQDGRYVFVNDRFAQIHGYKPEELLGEHYLTLIHPDEKERVKQIGSKRLKGEPAAKRYEVKRLRKDGEAVWCATIAVRIEYRGKPAIMGNIVDINERKQAEQTLRERENELEIKTGNLEEANTALKVLLKKRDEDKIELEEKVLSNVKELVVPYLEKLKKSGLDDRQETYLGILESSLNDIISPFLRHLSSKYLNLTPTQIQIANLVKEGKTTKEIAELLASTRWAIDFHRNNLRKKLGLTNKKANLRTYLLSLT